MATKNEGPKPITITVSYLRDNMPEVLARARFNGQKYIVVKHGKRCAVISPPGSK